MSATPRFTQEDYDSLARAVPEYDGWHEMEWTEEEIEQAMEALSKMKALIDLEIPPVEPVP